MKYSHNGIPKYLYPCVPRTARLYEVFSKSYPQVFLRSPYRAMGRVVDPLESTFSRAKVWPLFHRLKTVIVERKLIMVCKFHRWSDSPGTRSRVSEVLPVSSLGRNLSYSVRRWRPIAQGRGSDCWSPGYDPFSTAGVAWKQGFGKERNKRRACNKVRT